MRRLSADQQLLKDCRTAINEVLEEWQTPDSPEGFAYAMKGLQNLRDRIAARFPDH